VISIEEVDKIGSIRVTIFRSRTQKLETPYIWDGVVTKPCDELPEKLMKGRSIKNNTMSDPISLSIKLNLLTRYYRFEEVDFATPLMPNLTITFH
jgi:hypothetical protein